MKATPALAWWSAPERQVRLVLFGHAPSAVMLAAAKKGSFGEEELVMRVDIGFTSAGRTLAAVSDCFVNVHYPKGGPIGTNTDAKGCGLERVVTDGKPGGTVQLAILLVPSSRAARRARAPRWPAAPAPP